MAASLPQVVTFDLGPVRHALWCPDCALPSAVEVDAYLLTSNGVTRVCTARRCLDCGRRD